MAVSYASNRVTISGAYKSGTALSGSSPTTIEVSSGATVAGDIGRLIAWVPSSSDASQTQVRRIESVSGTTVTVHDDWIGSSPASGDNWRVAHNCQDVHDIGDAALEKIGDSSYRWDADWILQSNGFFGDADISLETNSRLGTGWSLADGSIIQFGLLWGGEANGATETTNGCRLEFRTTDGTHNVYSGTNSRSSNGGVVNYYGSLIESSTSQDWMFQRMRGPTRFIGNIFDGVMGGRFYHEASEWAECRMSGNNDITPAWSLGATFTRFIDSVKFFRNLVAIKSYLDFGGTFRNTIFEDSNTDIIISGANTSSIVEFVDCTTFGNDKIIDTGSGRLIQRKSVNYTVTDESGFALQGVGVRINEVDDNVVIGATQSSDVSGVVPEMLIRLYEYINNPPMSYFGPFRIRIRDYDKQWLELASDISSPIKQIVALQDDANVTQTESEAGAHTGISVTFESSPVTWNGKDFSITVTGDLSVNPSLTLDDIKHYLRVQLHKTASFASQSSGLAIHDLLPIAGSVSARGNYGNPDWKGVRVIDQAGNSFPSVTQHQADDGTYYVAPTTDDLIINSSESGSQIIVFATGTQTELASESSVSQLIYTHSNETVDITVMKAGFIPFRQTGVVLSGDVTISAQLAVTREYDASHGLVYSTDASWSSNQLIVPAFGPTVQGVFSLMIDSFISEASLRNTAFNLEMDGINSLYLVNDAEGDADSSIENMTRGGVGYISTAGATTSEWFGVLSIGDNTTGETGEYQQVDGSGTTDARATGSFDEIIKMYGDATHGNFDYRDHTVFKYQINGFYQVRVDILDTFGISQLEPMLYVIPLSPKSTSLSTGDPAISITITDHTSAPITVGGKLFDYEVIDNGANSAEDILREISYSLSLDATYQGKDPFNWPDMVINVGATYETGQGFVEGQDTTTTSHGFYVSRGGDDHPDFTRFQSNDGTYYVTPVLANAQVSSIEPNSRLRVYNQTTATETVNQIITGSGYSQSYTDGTDYSSGDVIIITLTYQSGTSAKLGYSTTVIATSNGWSAIAAQEDDSVYAANNIDGSTITKFTADYVSDEVDISSAANFTAQEFYAWWAYNLSTEEGIREFFDGVLAQDQANYLIQSEVVNVFWDNLTASNVRQTDSPRIYRSDGVYPVKNGGATTGGGGIDINWQDKVFLAVTGSGPLTPAQDAQLFATALESTAQGISLTTDEIDTRTQSIESDVQSIDSRTISIQNGVTAIQAVTDLLIQYHNNNTVFLDADISTEVSQASAYYMRVFGADGTTPLKTISFRNASDNPVTLTNATRYVLL